MHRFALFLVLLLLTLTACGGGDAPSADSATTPPAASASPPTATAALPDICTLLTVAEIERILGEAPVEGALPETPGPPQCLWLHQDGATTQVHLLVTPAPAPTLDSYLEQARESLGENAATWTLESVEGLGEFAVVMGPPNYPVLQIVDQGILLQITTQEGNDRTTVDNARLLADLVLPRLFSESGQAVVNPMDEDDP